MKFKDLPFDALFQVDPQSPHAYRKLSSKCGHKEHDENWIIKFDPEIEIFLIKED